MNIQSDPQELDRKLRERLLLGRAVVGDRLMLADATLLAALDGARALTANERGALERSPLTLRRFRHLSAQRRRAASSPSSPTAWSGSVGMLRAAADGAALAELRTDDGCWSLHFVEQGTAWRVILALAAGAPFAPRLMREQPMLRVLDGGGAVLLQGRLDADGECECAWPFESAPGPHLQSRGARFAVEALAP
ncbi:hypothetical protein AAKU55_003575 [Oxalobacteraceae bacterium GrIS 1.11]